MNQKTIRNALRVMMIFITIIVIFSLIPNSTKAVKALPLYIGIVEIRTNDTPNLGYAIGDPNTNEATGESNKIWNLVEYTEDGDLKADGEKNIYCLKAGIGFTNTDRKDTYTIPFDMKKQRGTIAETNSTLRSIVEGTVPYTKEDGSIVQVDKYNSLLALGDMLYLINNDEDIKINYLKKAGIYQEDWDTILTRDEIAAIQQAAIWYFTNYEAGSTTFGKTAPDSSGWLNYTENGTTYKDFKQYNPTNVAINDSYGSQRQQQAEQLYRYLIKTAKEKSVDYENLQEDSETSINEITGKLEYKESGNDYILGPIDIPQKNTNTASYKIEFSVKANGSTVQEDEYTILDKTEQPVAEDTKIEDLAGEAIYISIPKTKGRSFAITGNIKYTESVLTLYTAPGDTIQPILIPEKTLETIPIDLEVEIPLQQSFDLKLIKRIIEKNGKEVPERIEAIDVSKLNTTDAEGNRITTGEYKLNKKPIGVKKGDIVTYALRVYNEGTIDGYAKEITEDIPEGLEFLWQVEGLDDGTTLTKAEQEAVEFNQKYLWGNFKYDENGEKIVQISTDYLSKDKETTVNGNLIKAFGENDGTKTEKDIDYKEVYVKMKVISEAPAGEIITNEAAITEDSDSEDKPVDDRDSHTDTWTKSKDDEDDEDYDKIILQIFDLSLRKFIIAVSEDTTIENNEYLRNEDGSFERAPKVDTSKLNTLNEENQMIETAIYNHTKKPVLVQRNDIVVYMLRVYNEGDIDGYAAEIKDHLPPNLEFVDSKFNEQYGWEKSEDGRTVTTTYLKNEKIKKAEKDNQEKYVLSYKEVPIMCKVIDTAPTNQNITNIADISKYEDENHEEVVDRDSTQNDVDLPDDVDLPKYKDNRTEEYISGQQDDDDFEKVVVKEFDLALRKWVTQAIVTDKSGTQVTNTGHQPYDDPEQIVKVELNRKKLNEVTVKFRYSIRVINEGDIEGYAKEVTDYIPEGLKFVASDNPGWTDEGNNVISTKLLENTLLKPGEYADVEILLTWINNQNNMGLKVNTAEISEDYNEYGVPDKDSTPDNQKIGEDDIDDAPVMLSISTGQARIYFTLGFTILFTIATGLIIIKKYVL